MYLITGPATQVAVLISNWCIEWHNRNAQYVRKMYLQSCVQ